MSRRESRFSALLGKKDQLKEKGKQSKELLKERLGRHSSLLSQPSSRLSASSDAFKRTREENEVNRHPLEVEIDVPEDQALLMRPSAGVSTVEYSSQIQGESRPSTPDEQAVVLAEHSSQELIGGYSRSVVPGMTVAPAVVSGSENVQISGGAFTIIGGDHNTAVHYHQDHHHYHYSSTSPFEIDQKLARSLLEELKVSSIADHKYHLEGDQAKSLRRATCTPNTRVRILNSITEWANSTSNTQPIYWLFGPGGSGKSTIALTVTREFDVAVNTDGATTILGANFFCSRQFQETRSSSRIVRTIVYQLALKCKAFASALSQYGDLTTVNQGPFAQLRGLLIEPWSKCQESRMANKDPVYLITIEALDELEGEGGRLVWRAFLHAISSGQLPNLKFFITSRPDPELVAHVATLGDGQICHLAEVTRDEADADVKTYLEANLGKVATEEEIHQLVRDAAGLFIYASTVIECLKGRHSSEQRKLLKKFLGVSTTSSQSPSRSVTAILDKLYLQILEDALVDPRDDPDEPELFHYRLHVLHTFLCTFERTSTSVVTRLQASSEFEDDSPTEQSTIADRVLQQLHAVLYVSKGRVVWFHKSFPDLIFDKDRSQRFFCDQEIHHRRLVQGCFREMKRSLRFNIAQIPSSYLFDRDNHELSASVQRNIAPSLRYASQFWRAHLAATPRAKDPSDPILKMLEDFLQLPVLFWIETMHLLGNRGDCEGILLEAQTWPSILPRLAHDLGEAAIFALYFSGSQAALSTPHLYISSLATFPRESTLRATWRSQFSGLPSFTNRLGGTSNDGLLMTIKAPSCGTSVALFPDGRKAVSGSTDGQIRVWDLTTGQELKALQGHTDSVDSVALSADGSLIVSGSDDHSIRVWDARTWDQQTVLEGHSDNVTSVSVSPVDNSCIVSSSEDKTVRVWDSVSAQHKVLKGHTDAVLIVRFSPDGLRVVSGSADMTIRVWDLSTGEQLKVIKGHTDAVSSVVLSRDGSRIVSGAFDYSVRMWDALTGKELMSYPGHASDVLSVVLSPDGSQIVSSSMDNTIRVWDVYTGEMLKVLNGHTDWVTSVAFLPSQASRIVSVSFDETLRVWDSSTGKASKATKSQRHKLYSIALSPDGSRIATGSNDRSVRVWDSSGKELCVFRGHKADVNSVAFSPNGCHIVSGSDDHSVRMWELEPTTPTSPWSAKDLYGRTRKQKGWKNRVKEHIGLIPDVLNVLSTSKFFTLHGVKALKGHKDGVLSVAFSPDGSCVASGSVDRSVRLWDSTSGKKFKALTGHADAVTSVGFSPDGSRIVSGSVDNTARVWDSQSGETLKVLTHTDWVTSIAFSPNGCDIVSGSSDCLVRVWDARTGKKLKVLDHHFDYIESVAYSTDGSQIVSASADRTMGVWNASSGENIRVLRGHTSTVYAAAFSPDGSRIASASADGTVRIWDVSPGHALRYMRELADPDGKAEDAENGKADLRASTDAGRGGKSTDDADSDSDDTDLSEDSESLSVTSSDSDDDEERESFEHNGWLVSPQDPSAYLMFIPLQERLPDDCNILTIPSAATPFLDLSNAKLGRSWDACYRGPR